MKNNFILSIKIYRFPNHLYFTIYTIENNVSKYDILGEDYTSSSSELYLHSDEILVRKCQIVINLIWNSYEITTF